MADEKITLTEQTLNQTPSANRIHIGVFGRTNSGKSSIINAFAGHEISIVSERQGTTTDPVYKAMEINPIGPCVLIDTAGFGDDTELGTLRMEKTELALDKSDVAILVAVAENGSFTKESAEYKWYKKIKEKNIPVLLLVNKSDIVPEASERLGEEIKNITGEQAFVTSEKKLHQSTGSDFDQLREQLARLIPENISPDFITGDLVNEGDVVVLVMPQDIQAPKGRLILPQVQTIRELLDRKCIVVSTVTDKLEATLSGLAKSPRLIITDSQVFDYVYERKPEKSLLTSFSVLFAAYKGDIEYYLEGARAIDSLTENSRVLIAECCTHAPLSEDIGRVKLPRLLRKRVGQGLAIDMVSGVGFPQDLKDYDLIIQCGACMFNRRYVLSRIHRAKVQNVPMTNYGVTIAHLTGILEKVSF